MDGRPAFRQDHRPPGPLLGRAIVHCGLPERSWAMCALAWVRWAVGIASAADTLVREAARIDPANSLAPVYAAILHSTYPAWIFDFFQSFSSGARSKSCKWKTP